MCPRDRETFRNIHETHMLEENVACNNKRRQHIKILYFVFAQNYLKIKTLEDANDINKTSHKKNNAVAVVWLWGWTWWQA